MSSPPPFKMLCLGDSYTIGEAVAAHERFGEQVVEMLKSRGVSFNKPVVVARTGWTTGELAAAISAHPPQGIYDFVTLLIGVNNQYRKGSIEDYRREFRSLMHTAIEYAGGQKERVAVLSIPDWGVTPFIDNDTLKRTRQQVAHEIDLFNAVNKDESQKAGVMYIDITPISRRALSDPELTTNDGLHPSAKMYAAWAELLADAIEGSLTTAD